MHVCYAQVAKLATAAGAMKAVQLAVSGAFHTPLMQPAREALVEVLYSSALLMPRCQRIYEHALFKALVCEQRNKTLSSAFTIHMQAAETSAMFASLLTVCSSPCRCWRA